MTEPGPRVQRGAVVPAGFAVFGGCTALLLAAATPAGCGGSSPPEDGSPELTAPDSVTGTVRRVGSTPFSRTVLEGDDTVTVTGPVEDEVARLSGARVRVYGEISTGRYPGPTLAGMAYEILSVDGERPRVGVLRADDEGLYLAREGRDPVRLRAVTSGLESRVGAKVWVVTGDDGVVRRYGILRPAEK